jgi:hypothetical protein
VEYGVQLPFRMTMTKCSAAAMIEIHVATKDALEDLALALAEGEHDLGEDATAAGGALITWPGADCPWFVPGPSAGGFTVADFAITEAA